MCLLSELISRYLAHFRTEILACDYNRTKLEFCIEDKLVIEWLYSIVALQDLFIWVMICCVPIFQLRLNVQGNLRRISQLLTYRVNSYSFAYKFEGIWGCIGDRLVAIE